MDKPKTAYYSAVCETIQIQNAFYNCYERVIKNNDDRIKEKQPQYKQYEEYEHITPSMHEVFLKVNMDIEEFFIKDAEQKKLVLNRFAFRIC